MSIQGTLHFEISVKDCAKCAKHTTVNIHSILVSKNAIVKHFHGPDTSKCAICNEPFETKSKARIYLKSIQANLEDIEMAEEVHEKLIAEHYMPTVQRLVEYNYSIEPFGSFYMRYTPSNE